MLTDLKKSQGDDVRENLVDRTLQFPTKNTMDKLKVKSATLTQ